MVIAWTHGGLRVALRIQEQLLRPAIQLCRTLSCLAYVALLSGSVLFTGYAQEAVEIGTEDLQALISARLPISGLRFEAYQLEEAVQNLLREGEDISAVFIEECEIEGVISLADLGTIGYLNQAESQALGIPGDRLVSRVPTIYISECVLDGLVTTKLDALLPLELHQEEISDWETPVVLMQGHLVLNDSTCQNVVLRNGRFEQPVQIERSTLDSLIILQCEFTDDLTSEQEGSALYRTYRSCSLERTSIQNEVAIEDSTFTGRVDFSQSSSSADVDFRGLSFHDYVLLDQFECGGRFRIEGCSFFARIDTTGLQARAGLLIEDTLVSNVIDRARLCLVASKSWDSVGDNEAADSYYYLYRVYRRQQRPLVFQYIEWLAVDVTCAYGTSWVRLARTFLVVVVLFTMFFWLTGGITNAGGASNHTGFLRRLPTAAYFTIVTFTTLGYGDRRPTGWRRHVASVLAVLGVLTLALFIVVFSREFMR